MRLIARIKLLPTKEQHGALVDTLTITNEACNHISQHAWDTRTFRQYDLHKAIYYEVREHFGLSAQMTVRAIAKVADAYKKDRQTRRTFKTIGGVAYDDRILSYNLDRSTVSIWTTQGRLTIPFTYGPLQKTLLNSQRGESDLILFKGDFYLLATCDVDEPTPKDVEGVLGVDLGIVNVATTSDGDSFSGKHINNVRYRHRRLRKKLQTKQTKSAKRRLKKLSGKEARFAAYTNHVISKQIVKKAQDTNRAIALEKLTGIRDRVTVRKSQRDNLHSWSFYQLKGFIAYKAKLAGIPLIEVDPRNSSRTCPTCGCVDKHNRKSQSSFVCTQCACAGNADHFAAVEISRRGVVNHPYISTAVAIGSSKMDIVAAC